MVSELSTLSDVRQLRAMGVQSEKLQRYHLHYIRASPGECAGSMKKSCLRLPGGEDANGSGNSSTAQTIELRFHVRDKVPVRCRFGNWIGRL